MDKPPEKKPRYTFEIMVALGYLLFCGLATATGGWAFYKITARMLPTATEQNPLLTNMPPMTPTPHILANGLSVEDVIFKDNFTDNRNSWGNSEDANHIAVKDGELTFGSSEQGKYAMTNSVATIYMSRPYYLQADLAVDQTTAAGFGVFFGRHVGTNDFYLFEIIPETKEYYLMHHTGDSWSKRMEGTSAWIRSYPFGNNLGLFVDNGILEFYINHKIIDAYQDSGISFQTGGAGFYVDNFGFQLIVTNFALYKAGGQ